ncbi:PAS domain S-box protein [Aureimonas fodinaquatilis]|uniref:histidine kinase n=2 Tax=Aureimonas fodinaquatilis TaxID=2565783 RepID=A0A5B0DXY8_9HYPH|nr:PAS domain S-box protein [Aureimonas fodinaquatilis]
MPRESSSQLARLISDFDWASTSLGAIDSWPSAVRSTVDMMLRSPIPIVTLWGEAGVMIYNDAYSIFAGSRHPDLLGSDVREGWPEVADFNDHVIKSVFRNGEILSFKDQELVLNRGNGPASGWMNLDYSPIVDSEGRPQGVIAFVVETTEKVVADKQLRDERARLQQMYEQSPSLMALLEGPQHCFVFANPAYQQFIGQQDVIGRTVSETFAQKHDLDYLTLLDTVYTTGQTHRENETTYELPTDVGVQRRHVDFVFQPITDVSGTVTGIFINGVDVTERIAAQEAIREREAQFQTFAEVMPNHVWTSRPDGMLDWFNDRVNLYSGLTNEQLAGQGWAGIVHKDDQDNAKLKWQAALSSGALYETEFRIRRADGEYRWHLVRALPIKDDTGSIGHWIGTNTDIHDQKLAEAETVEDRNRLWKLSQELMLVCDYAGVITAVNPTAERLLGWSEQEMVGRTLAEFLHSDDLQSTADEVRKLTAGEATLAFQNRYRRKDGSYCLLDWTAVPDGGRIHAVGRDITEERRLARDRERIWNLSPVLKVMATNKGGIVAVNPAWTDILGWSEADTLGKSIFEFLPSAHREPLKNQLKQLVDGAERTSLSAVVLTKDGEERHIDWTVIRENQTIYGFGRDITNEEQAAAALAISEAALRQAQKMEAIGQLTGGIAHDFNNLLQVVGGNLQLLAKNVAGDDKAQRRVQNAMEGVSRGARLASQLLAFGRRQPLAPKAVNLGRLIRSMDAMLRHALGEAIEIETMVAGGLWNTLIDPNNLENALLNLAINARDAMEGHGKLTIEAGNAFLDDRYVRDHPDVSAGQYVLLAVTDTGTGIAASALERVFDPFYTTKSEGKGSGLGLSMVYGFVKQSGGHIKIYSELGEGTTVRLYLPRSTQSEDDLVRHDAGPVTGGTETILVAEDDEGVRETVVETLSDLGYKVLQASDAAGALAIIESGIPIDLLFTDVVMPGPVKSTELARKAVQRMPRLSVLFTSGYTENSIVHAGRLDEGVELLSKPYTREDLARKIRHQLANAAQHGTARSVDPIQTVRTDEIRPFRILVCEDESLIRMSIVDMLEAQGHFVVEAGDAGAALALLGQQEVDILITDVGLPDMPGTELASRARNNRPMMPVIFATGYSRVEGVVEDDTTRILSKPFDSVSLSNVLSHFQR